MKQSVQYNSSEHTNNNSDTNNNNNNNKEELEIYRHVLSTLTNKIGAIPEEMMTLHILSATEGMDFPPQNEATKEVIKRFGFYRRDKLKPVQLPKYNKVLGIYSTGNTTGKGKSDNSSDNRKTTKASASKIRPYDTLIRKVSSIDAACNCPDFVKNSLGVCKHILCVYEAIFAEKTRLLKGKQEEDQINLKKIDISWYPIKDPINEGDVLAQISWNIAGIKDKTLTKATWNARRWFRKTKNSEIVKLEEKNLTNLQKRKQLLIDLKAVLKESSKSSASSTANELDPALIKIIEAEFQKSLLQTSFTAQSVLSHLKSLKKKLFPYQVESVTKFLEQKRLLIADDMGLGKTAQAISICHILWRAKKVTKGILVVPAALKSQWKREWTQFSDTPVEVVEGVGNERHNFYKRSKGFLIINYEQLIRDFTVINSWAPQLVILDEAQKIKNWATKNSAYVKALTPDYRVVLTGTPFENRLEELASVLDWVDPYALEPKWRLVPWHAVYSDNKKEIIGARNLGTIRKRLNNCFIRRQREEVIKQLPSRKDTSIPVELSEQQSSAHLELDPKIVRIYAISKKRPLTQGEFLQLMSLMLRQRVISNGMLLADFEARWDEVKKIKNPSDETLIDFGIAKLVELRKLIQSIVIEQGRKAIIFSQWRRMLKLAEWAITPLLEEKNLRLSFFTGHESQKRRTQNIVELHDDPSMVCLLLSDAGGVGLNLQRAADCCINLDLPWNPAVLEQRIGRIHRFGQKNPVDIYNIISINCIESRIAGIIGNKKALFSGLFDGQSDTISFSGSTNFMSQLARIIEPTIISEQEKSIIELPVEDIELESADTEDQDSFPVDTTNDVSDTLPESDTEIDTVTGTDTKEDRFEETSANQINSNNSSQEIHSLQEEFDMTSDSSTKINSTKLNSNEPAINVIPGTKDLEVTKLSDGRLNIVASERVSGLLADVFQQLAESLRN